MPFAKGDVSVSYLMSNEQAAMEEFETTINGSYARNYVLYLPVVRKGKLQAGTLRVRVKGVDDFLVEGTLHGSGALSGMAKLYKRLALKSDDVVKYTVISSTEVQVVAPRELQQPQIAPEPPVAGGQTVRKHIHFEAFRPDNLFNWSPEAEVDVYMAFGVLQENTDLKYCCGVNAEILKKLGVAIQPKPDAILIDRVTDEYLIAEFEVNASNFASTHKPSDVDVLVCWENDEPEGKKLPRRVLALDHVAREVAKAQLELPEA